MARTDEPAEVRAGEEADPVLASMWRHERAARIDDGPEEMHKSVVAREVMKPYGVKVEV